MTLPHITLDVPTLKLALSIVGGLLLLSMIRIVFLLRTNNRLQEITAKMEEQVLKQHHEILSVRSDSNAWRGELQRMFDAFRAEFSKRLSESEQRYQDLQQRTATAAKPTAQPIFPPPSASILAKERQRIDDKSVLPVPALIVS